MATSEVLDNQIDFERFHSALRDVNLLDCQGFVVRVAGQTVESSGPRIGLGTLRYPDSRWSGSDGRGGRISERPYYFTTAGAYRGYITGRYGNCPDYSTPY
ncbi:hypothetical protein ACFL3Q_14685 [Planctomycetota bacterium]